MDEIEINIFEYELAGYKQTDDVVDIEPKVYTSSLKATKEGCPLIKVENTEAGLVTRSCDVLEGILSTTKPMNGSAIISSFAEEMNSSYLIVE